MKKTDIIAILKIDDI